MGATAAIINAAGAGAGAGAGVSAATSMFMTVGLGFGGLAIALLSVFAFAYLDLLDGVSPESAHLRRMLVATVVPLAFTFAGVVLMQSLQVLGYLS